MRQSSRPPEDDVSITLFKRQFQNIVIMAEREGRSGYQGKTEKGLLNPPYGHEHKLFEDMVMEDE